MPMRGSVPGLARRYNSNTAHAGEMDDMLAVMEDALYQHGVDVVFAGHVHAYERSFRTLRRASHALACAAWKTGGSACM